MRITYTSLRSLVFKLVVLAVVDAFALQLAITLGSRISVILGIGIGVFTVIANVVYLDERLYPWRWVTPALAGMFWLSMMAILTIALQCGEGHLLSKQQVGSLDEFYAPPESVTYKTYVFVRSVDNPQLEDFRFWLVAPDGKTFIAAPGEAGLREVASTDTTYGERDANQVPKALGEFERTSPQRFSQRLQGLTLQDPPNQIRLTKMLLLAQAFESQQLQHRYSYVAATNTLTDRQTNKEYHEEEGTFVTGEGETREALKPGFEAYIGLENILRVVEDENVRDPFWRVFGWTLTFAAGTVVTQFALGLLFALVLNTPDLPLRALWRSILIIPYAVPFWLSVVTWRACSIQPTGRSTHD
jgi:ABC-type sugar transport system permease subunit